MRGMLLNSNYTSVPFETLNYLTMILNYQNMRPHCSTPLMTVSPNCLWICQWKLELRIYRIGYGLIAGQQHQQFRALGLGQRPYLDATSSFTSQLRELQSYRRNKHHHHQGSHLHGQTGNNPNNNNNNCAGNPNNGNPSNSPNSGSHLGNAGAGHQDCFKHSPQNGEFLI